MRQFVDDSPLVKQNGINIRNIKDGRFFLTLETHVIKMTTDSFCLSRPILIVMYRHLVVTFSIEEFSSLSQIKSFLLQCSELA